MALIGCYIIFEALGILFLFAASGYAGKDKKQNKEFLSIEAIRAMAAGLILLGTAFLAFTLFIILKESGYVFLYCITGCLGLVLVLTGFVYLGKKKVRIKYRKGQAAQPFSQPDFQLQSEQKSQKKPASSQQVSPDLQPSPGPQSAGKGTEVFAEQKPEGPSISTSPVRPSGYLHCRECGSALFPNDQFCPACGKPVQEKAEKLVPKAQEESGPKICRFCGAEIKGNELFCIHCGHRI